MSWAAVEQLLFTIPVQLLEEFFIADADTWTPFLQQQAGFGGKMQLFNSTENESGNVTITTLVFWESYTEWKAIPDTELSQTETAFVAAFGSSPMPVAIPGPSGWQLYQNSSIPQSETVSPLGCFLSKSIGDSMCISQSSGSSSGECNDTLEYYGFYYFTPITLLIIIVGAIYIIMLRREIGRLRMSLQAKSSTANLTSI